MKKWHIRKLCYLALLLAVQIVLSRFCSLRMWNMTIGFSFLPVVLCAMLFGVWEAAVVYALGDFLGATLFPVGAYFFGFTVTAFISGVLWGIFLRKKQTAARILLAVIINQTACSLLLNSLWISLLYVSPFLPTLVSRAVQCAIVAPIEVLLLFLLRPLLPTLQRSVSV